MWSFEETSSEITQLFAESWEQTSLITNKTKRSKGIRKQYGQGFMPIAIEKSIYV